MLEFLDASLSGDQGVLGDHRRLDKVVGRAWNCRSPLHNQRLGFASLGGTAAALSRSKYPSMISRSVLSMAPLLPVIE